VLHWVDRSRLLAALQKIDQELVPGGHLIIYDFYPERPCRRPYHHRIESEAFTYKQDYAETFVATRCYDLVAKVNIDRSTEKPGLSSDPENRAILAILRKRTLNDFPIE
jgi:SAM-dependent methyltransferase